MLLTRLERENKNMDKEKLKFYSIGRGSLNLNGKFYYGLDYAITDFMMDLEQQVKKQKEAINKIDNYINNYDVFKVFSFPLIYKFLYCALNFNIRKHIFFCFFHKISFYFKTITTSI